MILENTLQLALVNELHKTWTSTLTSLGGIMSKPTDFLVSISLKSFNIPFVFKQISLPQEKDLIEEFRLRQLILK